MSHVFITGSTVGLGLMAARLLIAEWHRVSLHARSGARAAGVRVALSGADDVVIDDLAAIAGMFRVAEQCDALGRFDAVIHDAGVGYREVRSVGTKDGLAHVFSVNVIVPYPSAALMSRLGRLVYLSSGMHRSGDPDLADPQWEHRRWIGAQAYADGRLFDLLFALAVARIWTDVLSDAVEPGWVPTKMGGPGAPHDLSLGPVIQAWPAVSEEPVAPVTGACFYHQEQVEVYPAAHDARVQDQLLAYCARLTGVTPVSRHHG